MMVGIIPFYCDRWLAGTVELTLEEQGAYIRWLASYAAHDGVFPDDLRLLSEIWRCDPRIARRLRASLIAKGKLYAEDELLHQLLIKSVVSRALSKSTLRANAAFKRWQNYRQNNTNRDANGSKKPGKKFGPSSKHIESTPSSGESQQQPPVDNPPTPTPDQPPQAVADKKATQQEKPPDQMSLAEINQRWHPAGTRP